VDRRSSERLEEPTRLGSYEIIRKLARGGMAELFLARGPDGLAVVKKILPKHADSPRFLQLFLDEARLAGSLDHPNIVRVFGADRDGATAFFAMEYLHGQDVRTMLHRAWTIREQVPVEHAVHVAARVAAALHHAHEQRRPDGTLLQIVHRDVSPSNIIVSYQGAVKLVDFGVAKAATSTVKTRTGALRGKVSYMSPEQARGAALDRRSDIFSLGIVLWEMITTQRLFRGENDLQTLQLIINRPPRPPSELQPACEPELDRIVLRALAQDPDARYQTAAELLRDLEDAASIQGLDLEAGALAGYLGQLFAPEVRSWEEAKAAGRTLVQHLTSGGELTIQLTESDFIEAVDLNAMIEDDDELDDDSELDRTEIQPHPEPALAATGPLDLPPPIARLPTPPVPLPVVRVGSAPVAADVAPAMPPPSAPVAPPPELAGSSEELAAMAPGPWAIARGSSAATPSAGMAVQAPLSSPVPVPVPVPLSSPVPVPVQAPLSTPMAVQAPRSSPVPVQAPPPGFALDPERADLLLRRGLWVGAALIAAVVVVAIIMAAVAGS
jgi:serine/threonine protein kinase